MNKTVVAQLKSSIYVVDLSVKFTFKNHQLILIEYPKYQQRFTFDYIPESFRNVIFKSDVYSAVEQQNKNLKGASILLVRWIVKEL